MGDRSLKTLKSALLGASFLIAAAGAASAADIYSKGGSYKDAPGEYMPAITWTGFYAGANAGGAFVENSGFIELNGERADFDEDDTFFVGGIHVGYNWQKPGGWVFGIEGDVGFVDDDSTDYLATIRGRLGYAMGPTLLYATGGAAFAGVDDGSDDSDTETGWVVGAGIEHKFSQNWSVGLEGLYYNFGDGEDVTLTNGEDVLRVQTDDADFFTVRARLTYHFGGRDDEPLK